MAVQAESPLQFSGTLKAPTAGGRRYKYSADLEFKVDVIWQPRPGGRVEEPVQVTKIQPEKVPFVDLRDSTIDLPQFVTVVTWMIVGTAMILLGYKQLSITEGTTSITPFVHPIDPNTPRNQRYFRNNAS